MQWRGGDPCSHELHREVIGAVPGGDEHQDARPGVRLEEVTQQHGAPVRVDLDGAMDDVGGRLGGKGEADGQTTVSGRLLLARYNLRDRDPSLQAVDERLVQQLRSQYALLRTVPAAPAPAPESKG